MEHNSDLTQRQTGIPPMVWFLTIGLLLALTAIVVFNVPVGTVANYGLLALFVGAHFFMHGSHSGHGSQGSANSSGHQHGGPVSNAPESDQPDQDTHAGHTGGCH